MARGRVSPSLQSLLVLAYALVMSEKLKRFVKSSSLMMLAFERCCRTSFSSSKSPPPTSKVSSIDDRADVVGDQEILAEVKIRTSDAGVGADSRSAAPDSVVVDLLEGAGDIVRVGEETRGCGPVRHDLDDSIP